MLPAFVPFRFPGQQHRIAHCQIALIEQLPGTFCDHLCHRSHFGSRYSSGRCDFAVFFWCHHSKKPVQGFEQGLNKVSSFQAVPIQDPPPNAYLCHFQSAFCPTLPIPPMPCFQMGANSLLKRTPSRIAARHMRPPGVEPGAQAWEACTLPLHYRRHDTSQETRQWLLAIAPLLSLLSLSQATQRCSQTSDSEGGSNPCGQSPMDFWSISLATRTHCHACSCLPHSAQGLHIPPHGHLSRVYTSLGQPQPSSRNFFLY